MRTTQRERTLEANRSYRLELKALRRTFTSEALKHPSHHRFDDMLLENYLSLRILNKGSFAHDMRYVKGRAGQVA